MKSSCTKAFVFRWLVTLICVVLGKLGIAETNSAAWPNWMGPHHDGVSSETGWSTEWSDQGLPLVWKQAIGIGFSSVAIADGRLFTMGHVDGQEFVYCFDAITGKAFWSHAYDAPLVDNLHEGGPGSTPTVDGEFLYTLGRAGQLICFRAATGQVLWTRQLQEDLGVTLPEWGFTSSPYVLGNQLFFEAGRVVSYDKTSGKKNWQTDKHQPGYGSATVFFAGGNSMVATLDCDGLRVVRSRDGHEVAFTPCDSPYRTNSTTPIVDGDLLFISTGYNVGCGLFRLRNNELEMVYQNRDMRNQFNNSILLDGYLYGFDGNSNLGQDRRFLHSFGTNRFFSVLQLDREWIRNLKVFYVGGLFAMPNFRTDELAELLKYCRAHNVVTVVDVVVSEDMCDFGQLDACLPHIDYFLPNDDEAARITGRSDPAEQARIFRDKGVATTIVTLGETGALAMSGDNLWRVGTFPVEFVDMTGCGDAFDAGLISGVLKNWDLPRMLTYATALGGSCAQALGAYDGVFTADEADTFLQTQQVKIEHMKVS